jgi:hypothetical protein
MFEKAIYGNEKPPLRSIEIMNARGSLLELKNFHEFHETLVHLSIHYFELDLFNEYIEDQDALMVTAKDAKEAKDHCDPLPIMLLTVLTNQIQILEIHKGHPLKRDIFTHSIAYSTSIKDLKIAFDWQVGPLK